MSAKDPPISTLGEHLREMIAAQPASLRAIAEIDVSQEAALLAGARRIFVVGTGSSFHAAQLGAYLLRSGGFEVHAVSAAEAARWRPDVGGHGDNGGRGSRGAAARDAISQDKVEGERSPGSPEITGRYGLSGDGSSGDGSSGDGVIVISHTGETAYAKVVREAMLRVGGPLVTITGPGSAWEEAIVTPIREQADTYTVSYTGALAVLGLLGAALIGADTGAESILGTAEEVERILGAGPHAQISAISAPERALAVVGPGPWAATAREGALKVREAAHIIADGFDSEALLHGAAVPYRAGDALIALGAFDDEDGLTPALVEAARDSGVSILELGAAIGGSNATNAGDTSSRGKPATPSERFLAQIPATVSLQLLAESFARQRGADPDTVITGAWTRDVLWSAGAPST